MSNAVLKVGNLTLSKYLGVQPEDGMDTYDPTFTEKVFAHSLLKEGGTFALENLQLKEMVFPLLYGPFTIPERAEKVQELNRELNAATPIVVEWQDFGATNPTFFDLSGGQFDIEYDFRKGQQGYVKGKLRLFVQPFGRQPTPITVALAVASGPLLQIPIATTVRGDAPALLQTILDELRIGAAIVSVLPTPEWQAAFNLASSNLIANNLIATTSRPTAVNGSGAWATSFLRIASIGAPANMVFPNPSSWLPYTAQTRVLAIARTPSPAGGVAMQTVGPLVGMVGPTALMATASYATDWQLVDLGLMSIPSLMVSNNIGFAVAPLSNPMYVSVGAVTSHAQVDIAGLIALPDNNSVFLPSVNEAILAVDGVRQGVIQGGFERGALARGAIPRVPAGVYSPATPCTVVVVNVGGGTGAGGSRALNLKLEVIVNLLERTRWVFP